MLRLFRRKQKKLCFHEWKLADYYTSTVYNGVDVDFVGHYKLGCLNCGSTRVLDEFEYRRMLDRGLIQDVKKLKNNI
ncbi:hypothetical protein Goe26_01850 [Bacillus phage vB_BsuM-Goe26]|nr:hypothetical protein Goe26_01850 [Bacillus phage vB_BsuM-Goe26]